MDARALLDELMGKDRDVPLHARREPSLTDSDVCRWHLVNFCPHDLFHNTRSDLGPCPNEHVDALREPYLAESASASTLAARFEAEYLAYLERLLIDLDRRIRRSKERLNKDAPPPPLAPEEAARVSELGRRIEELVEKADSHGQEGRVDEAQACLREVEDLRAQRASALAPATATGEYGQSVLEKEKRMVVCDICGAMQDATDTEKRLSSHLDGKQHVGYQRIRQTVETMKAKRQEEREARNKQQEAVDNKDTSNGHHGSPAAKDRDRDRSPRGDHNHRSHARDADGERDRRRHHGHESRDRGREYHKSGGSSYRDQQRRSRDSDHRRRRSRSRDRGPERAVENGDVRGDDGRHRRR